MHLCSIWQEMEKWAKSQEKKSKKEKKTLAPPDIPGITTEPLSKGADMAADTAYDLLVGNGLVTSTAGKVSPLSESQSHIRPVGLELHGKNH